MPRARSFMKLEAKKLLFDVITGCQRSKHEAEELLSDEC